MRRLVVAGLLFLAPAVASAQERAPSGRCVFRFSPRGAEEPRVSIRTLPNGIRHSFLGGGVRGVCPEQNLTIVSDSVEYYEDTRLMYLIGDVHYTEPRLTLDANRVTYWQNEERLRAQGNVDATLPSGTNLKGPVVDYYRPVRGIRPFARMIAPQRPTISVIERDSTGAAGEPVIVVANTVVMEADSLVYASGNVVLTRPDMVARGDSAFVDNGREFARLMRTPVVEGKGDREFTLTGRVIDVYGRNRQLERARSIGNAKAVSDSTTIFADTLDFVLTDAQLERAYAWGPTRARVTSPSYQMLADSLDVRMPNQRVDLVHAIGGAYIESDPDSTRFRSDERDWLRGDTIIAQFDTARTSPDDTTGIAIRLLEATGNARSFYQLVPRDSTARRPAINYVIGRAISIAFEDRQVQRVSVLDQASGVYLEPGETPSPAPPTPGAAPPQRPPTTPATGTVPARRPPTSSP